MLIESKQIDFNNIIFHVVNHPTIPDNYEIAKGNHSFAAYLQLKASRKPVPSTLKCKVYERKENYGIFEIALTAGQVIKGSSYSYMEKVVAMRVTLEKNQISREIATKTKRIQYAGTFEDAKAAFGLPSGINEDQAHFLLSNRFIQKQLTRKPNFDINAAKLNILAFLKSVDNVQFEHFEDASSLDGFQLIFSFAEVDWEHTELPKHCLILDFCSSNDEFLGQDIPIAWKFMVITKNVQTPVNGKLPLITSPLRLYWHSDGPDGDDGSYARTILQTKAEEKSIKLGNVFDVNNIGTLFKFCDNESSVILIEPPIEYIDILISSLMEEIKKVSKLTVIASNSDKAKRFQSKLSNFLTEKWKKKAEEGKILSTPKKSNEKKLSTKNNHLNSSTGQFI
uniref:Uncharacterized protein n=1 Tax=Panagrolaimus superbus TaxID=310955 RepID=A0A914Z3X2_9BILA